jgi:hypothetical protein
VQDSGKEEIRLEARARHRLAERTLSVADGLPGRTARHYSEAGASSSAGGDRSDRTLPEDRRLVVATSGAEGLLCYSPGGPLTRDELDLVTEHFDPRCLPGLLPGKAMAIGGTWTVGDAAAHAASLLDSLIRLDLSGKLTGVEGGLATFTIDGSIEGIENGARVAMRVSASGKYHIEQKRVVELAWKQADDREAGPVNPASKVEAVVVLKREVLEAAPKELADAAIGSVRADPPAAATLLRHADSNGRYRFLYPRDWHITGESDPHLVLRLLDRGAFAVQATVTVWKKAEPGKHTTADEFKKAIAETPGCVADRVLDDGEVPVDGGRWLYRLSVAGRVRDVPVVQRFHLLAGPQGDQIVVTVTLPPERADAIGTRDLALVRAIKVGSEKPK